MATEQRRPQRVFISYRRRDAPGQAQLLWRYFVDRYKSKNVFFDNEGISVGAKFSAEIEQKVRECDVLVAVIGPRWIELIKENAIEEVDHVRMEIALALAQDKMVAPVCVGGAQRPDVKQMHWQVRPMMVHNAEVLSDPPRDAEIKRLLKSIEETFSRREVTRVATKLDEISPAAGLALGYFVNFIHKTVGLITEKTSRGDRYANSIEITELNGTCFCLANDLWLRPDFQLYIVFPPRLNCLRPENLNPCLQRLAQAAISQSNGDRPYRCHVCNVDGQYSLIDFPSPLKVVDEWIQRRKARGTPDQSPSHWRNLEAEELCQFRVVLQHWVDDLSKKSDFCDRIRLIRFPAKEKDLQWLNELWAS
jgi:hypothetical protein